MGVGIVALMAGLWLAWNAMGAVDENVPADTAATSSIDRIAEGIAQVREAMASPEVLETARTVLASDDADSDRLRRHLQDAGIANLIDVRVFPPSIEDIETGAYPEPNFGVIQMLLSARQQGSAPAEVHYPGTANENLAFAQALRSADSDEQGELAGYLFVRLPVSVVTRRLAEPGEDRWLAVQQGETVIAGKGSRAGEGAPGGQAIIADSQLSLHWARAESTGGAAPMMGGAVAGIGLLLAIAGLVSLRKAGRPFEPEETSKRPAEAEPPAEKKKEKETAASRPAAAAPASSEAGGDQQDLPDWMLDEAAGDDDAGPFSEPARQDSPDPEAAIDVPDLDEIYEQIEAEEAKGQGPAAGDEGASQAGHGARAADQGSDEPSEDDSLLELENFDFTEDSVEPDEEELPALDEELEFGESETDPEHESEGTGLDLDFAFSDAGDKQDEVALDSEPDAIDEQHEAPEAEGPEEDALELALEDDDWQERPDAGADEQAKEADVLDFDNSALELEPEPTSESEAEAEPKPEPDLEPTAEPEPQPESQPEPVPDSGETTLLPAGIFRSHQVLGIAEEDLTVSKATDIGQAIGSIVAGRGFSRIAVARDGRFSGPVLLSAVTRGLRNSGVDVIEIGAVPTPLLWFAATELAEGCGVMVTASHHPPEYNGFRMMIGGELIEPGGMAELARRAEEKDFAEGDGGYEQQDVLERYGKRLTTDIQLERPLKVVVDCGNGVGGAVVPKLLQAIGADLIPLYCDVDGAFPNHRPDPSSPDDLEDLRLCVRNFQADLGIAFDGDADRLVLVTRNGEIVWPDRLLMMLAAEIVPARPGEAVVFDVRCSGHLQHVVERAGGRGIMTATGQQPVAQRLREESAPLGGDMGGHLFVNDRWYSFDDAIYAAARLLEMLAADAREVDEILAEQPQFRASPEITIDIDREHSRSLVERLGQESDFGDAQLTRVDGLRVDWPDRWGLARVDADSGRLVLRFGADEAAALGQVRGEFREKLLELDPKLQLPY
ncbi:hypothetical protein [Wenzhouxiangella sp. EGI_FJ10305]|uniref:hypothetical protein n=1 Tax=Wenzhouxiangella sp. EGI_FJ10305 TaxID=3243768 RepID=UPI0035D6128B